MRVFALLILCGCWRGGETAETTPPTAEPPVRAAHVQGAPCEDVADHVRSIAEAGNDDNLRKRAGQIRGAIARRCVADLWSMELRRCLAGASTLDDTDGCEKLATPDQQKSLEHEVELMDNAD